VATPLAQRLLCRRKFRQHAAMRIDSGQPADRPACLPSPGDRLGVIAPAVILRVLTDLRADRIEIDVGGHRAQGVSPALDEHRTVTVLPDRKSTRLNSSDVKIS